jgi:hypothetical protein
MGEGGVSSLEEERKKDSLGRFTQGSRCAPTAGVDSAALLGLEKADLDLVGDAAGRIVEG